MIEILPSLESSPASEKEVDYSREGLDFGDEPPPPNTSKFSYLVAKNMEITSPVEVA